MPITVSASVLAADVLDFRGTVKRLEQSHVDMLHFDVMDGVFVPEITYGEIFLRAIHKISNIPLDVHLMTTAPLNQLKGFADGGASMISFHAEASSDISATARAIRSLGVKSALAVKPATPIETVYPFLDLLDAVLVMTVEPGRGGQPFDMTTLPKIAALRHELELRGQSGITIQVDGGINAETSVLVRSAGADCLVAGTYLFRAENMPEATAALKN